MSGGQICVPLVIRMATGAGRQLAAQHSHSLEVWYAHVPGLRVLTPATLEDARGMLGPALADPEPRADLRARLALQPGGRAAPTTPARSTSSAPHVRARRPRRHPGRLRRHARQGARRRRARWRGDGIEAEVIDLRVLRPLDDATILASVARTHRAVIVDEGWRSGSIAAEISARIMEGAFYELDAPVGRVCSAEVPIPYAKHLEDAALPQADDVVAAAAQGDGAAMGEFRMPSLGADMESGKLVEWHVKPGDRVKRGDIVATVDTSKAEIDVEIFEDGTVDELLVQPGERVPVGTVLATVRAAEVAASLRRRGPRPPQRPPRRAAPPLAPPSAAAARRARDTARRAAPRPSSASTSPPCAGTGPNGAVLARDVRPAEQPAAVRAGEPPRRAAPGTPPSPTARPRCARRSPPRWPAPSARSRTTTSPPTSTSPRRSTGWPSTTRRCRSPSALLAAVPMLKAVALALREFPQLNGYWVDGALPAAARRSTSASRSRCAAAGWSPRPSTTPTR